MGAERSREDNERADQRIPLIIVAGVRASHVDRTAEALRGADPSGTVVVHHDLRQVTEGVVRRLVRRGEETETAILELAHGCVSCTLREDLLPLLRRLCAAPDTRRIILHLDPALEPEMLSWSLHHVLVDSRPLIEDIAVRAVVTAVDLPSWLADAAGEVELAERGLAASADDERTLAQVAVGQVEFADALVLFGEADDENRARTEAVLRRLAPRAPIAEATSDPAALLDRVPAEARRGALDGAHGPLLRGQPSFAVEAGVALVLFEHRRPFHPKRLHEAFDALLEGVIRTRGRVWVASQPEEVLWIESAGGGLGVAHAGQWLCADPEREVSPERQVRAALNWDDYYGDRMQELVVLCHEADPEDIRRALHGALLTDLELAAGEQAWRDYPDPFQEWHVDPCADLEQSRADGQAPSAVDGGENQESR